MVCNFLEDAHIFGLAVYIGEVGEEVLGDELVRVVAEILHRSHRRDAQRGKERERVKERTRGHSDD